MTISVKFHTKWPADLLARFDAACKPLHRSRASQMRYLAEQFVIATEHATTKTEERG